MGWLNCGVTTQASWPKAQKEVKYGGHNYVLMPLTKEHSASIHIELDRIDHVEGMTLINRFLSALGWKCDEPAINHYGLSGNPVPVPVARYRIPFGYSPSDIFPSELTEITDKKARLAVALYREGKSLDNVPFQFLSYFKILNVFWKDKTKDGKNELVEGLRHTLAALTDGKCIDRINELEKKEGDAADYLYKSGRCAVAHAYADPIVAPDDVSDLRRLSEDLWLMKTATSYLIKKEFNLSQSLWE